MLILKKLLKILLLLILLVAIILGVVAALNWTLVTNLANAKNMRTDNVEEWETTRTAIIGRRDDASLITADLPLLSTGTLDSFRTYHQAHKGLSVAIWHRGEILVEEYADEMDANSLTASYSMNKSITGLVAATLDAEGVLSLDDPISMVLDEWQDDERGKITLQQLLQHTTPLEVISMSKPDFRIMEILMGDDVEKAALGIPTVEGPIGFNYATINYQVAGAVIRRYINKTYDKSYAQYLSTKIWQPIGAGDAWLSSGTENGIPRFYAGMQANLRDWLKVGILIKKSGLWNGQQVLPKRAITTLTQPSSANPHYGLGVWLNAPSDGTREYGPSTRFAVQHKAPYLVDDVIFFDGFGGQRVYIVPSVDLVVVRTSQVDLSYDDSVLLNLILSDPAISPSTAPQ